MCFDTDIAGYIKEKIWHESQEIYPRDDGSIIFEIEVAVTDEIKAWIMSWGAKAEALEPEFLREEIHSKVEEMLQVYKKHCPPKKAEIR